MKELEEFYHAYADGAEVNLSKLAIQYKDFALWQRNYLTGERLERQLSYWRETLRDYETLALITDRPRPAHIDYRGGEVYFELEEEVSARLRRISQRSKCKFI